MLKLETELYEEPPDSLVIAIGQLVSEKNPIWEGKATELTDAIKQNGYANELTPNWLVRSLNVQRNVLQQEGIRYVSRRTKDGKSIELRREGVR